MRGSSPIVGTRHRVIGAGLAALGVTGLHRLLAPWTRSRGAILTFHRVCAARGDAFAPNALLAVTPAFLDQLLGHVRRRGYDIVPLDAVIPRLRDSDPGRPFLALTFDDGYRDTLTDALPVLEHHAAPFTVYATTGFLERTARLWWVELEEAIRRRPEVTVSLGERTHRLPTRSPGEKSRAFATVRQALLNLDDAELLAACTALGAEAGVQPRQLVETLCLDWPELERLADHPLVTIGCHTTSHPRLARLAPNAMRDELDASRTRLTEHLRRPVRHLCYPYGFASAAGSREFAAAAALGYATAVTTRPDVLRREAADAPTALPRISVNGLYQTTRALDVLLSGSAFGVWKRIARTG